MVKPWIAHRGRLERHAIKRGKVRAVKMPIHPDACKGAVRGIIGVKPSSRRCGTTLAASFVSVQCGSDAHLRDGVVCHWLCYRILAQ
jgi:hypothetical protein